MPPPSQPFGKMYYFRLFLLMKTSLSPFLAPVLIFSESFPTLTFEKTVESSASLQVPSWLSSMQLQQSKNLYTGYYSSVTQCVKIGIFNVKIVTEHKYKFKKCKIATVKKYGTMLQPIPSHCTRFQQGVQGCTISATMEGEGDQSWWFSISYWLQQTSASSLSLTQARYIWSQIAFTRFQV